jgi:putative membrane protein
VPDADAPEPRTPERQPGELDRQPSAPTQRGPRAPDVRDSEAQPVDLDPRFSYANERTFLAWIRTALGLVTAGLAVTQLFPSFDFAGGRRLIGLPLIALGVLIAVFSLSMWQRNEEAMRWQRPLPKSLLPRIVAIVVSIVAIIGLVLAIFDSSNS